MSKKKILTVPEAIAAIDLQQHKLTSDTNRAINVIVDQVHRHEQRIAQLETEHDTLLKNQLKIETVINQMAGVCACGSEK